MIILKKYVKYVSLNKYKSSNVLFFAIIQKILWKVFGGPPYIKDYKGRKSHQIVCLLFGAIEEQNKRYWIGKKYYYT